MKALVTGGAGFIGSHLAGRLLEEGWQVAVVDDLSNGFERNLPAGVEFFLGSAADPSLLARVLPGCHAVFHLAAVSSVQASIERPLDVHETNATITLALLEGALRNRVGRFVFSSSSAVYGDTLGRPAREDMREQPVSHYAAQKLVSEHYCRIYRQLHGLETVCLRYFNVYGPRQRDDSPYSGVIGKFVKAARQGEALRIYGDGTQSRDFIHVSDVVAANMAAATTGGEALAGGVFNIGSGNSVSLREIASLVTAAFPQAIGPVFEARRQGEILHSLADIALARRSFGFDPRGRLQDFLAASV